MNILHVEDNRADSDLLKEAFECIGVEATLQVTHDAKQALRGLEQNLSLHGASSPDLIVLDLNRLLLPNEQAALEAATH